MDTAAGFTTADLTAGLSRIIAQMEVSEQDLNALDGKLGDGDLGVTMTRGGRHLRQVLPALPEDVGQALLICAQAFTKESGSSFGTLLASGLLSAAKTTKGLSSVPWREVSILLRGAVETMAARGKASIGDKTVLDAIDAVARATNDLDDPQAILRAARDATQETMDRLRPQQARAGRARIFGERSAGLDDPGMAAFYLMLRAL